MAVAHAQDRKEGGREEEEREVCWLTLYTSRLVISLRIRTFSVYQTELRPGVASLMRLAMKDNCRSDEMAEEYEEEEKKRRENLGWPVVI